MIDKKKLRKSLLILLLIAIIIIAIILIRNTLARYETTATSEKDVDVAFWTLDNSFKTDRLLIKDIYPSDTSFDYTFTVSNFEVAEDGTTVTKRAETDLNYELVLTATTNLPLEYSIQKNGKSCTKTETIYADEDGTYYKEIKLPQSRMNQGTDSTDRYTVKVTFPKSNYTNVDYADLIEYMKIDLTAQQIIE